MKRDLNYGQRGARQNVGQVLIQNSCNTSTAMARIQVPKKGTFTCNSSTAEEAVQYLRQVSLGCHSSNVHLIGGMVLWCTTLGKETLNQCALNGTEVGVVQWSEDV